MKCRDKKDYQRRKHNRTRDISVSPS